MLPVETFAFRRNRFTRDFLAGTTGCVSLAGWPHGSTARARTRSMTSSCTWCGWGKENASRNSNSAEPGAQTAPAALIDGVGLSRPSPLQARSFQRGLDFRQGADARHRDAALGAVQDFGPDARGLHA